MIHDYHIASGVGPTSGPGLLRAAGNVPAVSPNALDPYSRYRYALTGGCIDYGMRRGATVQLTESADTGAWVYCRSRSYGV